MIQVFGHTAPDTDATLSPIVWAWYLTEIRGEAAEPVLLGRPNTEAAFCLTHWGFEEPKVIEDVAEGQPVVILDTNNPAELPPSLAQADVRAIIDHHRLVGGIETAAPIEIDIQPLASTGTILWKKIGKDLAQAPTAIKGAILSCILSDTLHFRSPTTTQEDEAIAWGLAKDLDVDMEALATAMFEAKSDVSAFSDAELLRMDSKEYETGGTTFRVSVLETTAPKVVLDRKASLIETMPKVAAEDGVDQVLLFVVDILAEEATLLVPNDTVRRVAEASFATACGDADAVVLPGIMSRKKQIIPNLTVPA
ncbi:MAG: manganese-dependent inorganic pyrophosphatase [Shimia sp.]